MSVESRTARGVRTGARLTVLCVMAFVMIAPFLYLVSTSFKPNRFALEWPPQLLPRPFTVSNYTEAWSANNFALYFLNSTIVAVTATLGTVLLSAMAAYAFARFRFPGRTVVFWIVMLGLMVPAIVILIPQFVLARSLALTDSLTGLVVFYVGGGVAFCTFLLRGFFEQLPAELDESMRLDGAGSIRRFVYLYLPLSRPALATGAVFAFLAAWDEYPWARTTITDPDKQTLPLAIAQFQGQYATSWGLVFAASLIALIPVVGIYLFGQRHFVAGLTSGAVKS
jgi:multiple sugar transport system permease protein